MDRAHSSYLDPRAPELTAGHVHVEFEGRTMTHVCEIPRKALRDNNTVWVMNGDRKLEIRTVELAWREKESVLVRAGLKAGETVVTSSLPTPVPGMKLRLKGDPLPQDVEASTEARVEAPPGVKTPPGGRKRPGGKASARGRGAE